MRTVVLILRGCPAGWLGAYGNEWVVTPHLDQLASESVVFDNHLSDRPDAEGACRAWMGGEPGVLEQLRAGGIPSFLIRANQPDTDLPEWFYAGWEEVFDLRPRDGDASPLLALQDRLATVLERLNERPDYLLWIEIDRLLPPWDVSQEVFEAYLRHELSGEESRPEHEPDDTDLGADESRPESGESISTSIEEGVEPWCDPPTGPIDSSDTAALDWLATSFGSVVTMLDTELGSVIDHLRSHGLDRSATWIVTSDFGYPLGEHGQIGVHRPWLHEELVHVPLFIRLPGGAEAGRRVRAITQPPDLPAVLVECVRAEPRKSEGLLGLAHGDVDVHRPHGVSSFQLGGWAEKSVRTDDWAYLLPVRTPEAEPRQPLLFRKPEDRWEVNDLRTRNVELADELENILRKEQEQAEAQSSITTFPKCEPLSR